MEAAIPTIDLGKINARPNSFFLFLTCLFLTLVGAALGFGSGYLYGQLGASNEVNKVEKLGSVIMESGENKTFTDNQNGYQITVPAEWEIKENSEKNEVFLGTKELSIEIWLEEEKPFTFEDPKAVKTTKIVTLKTSSQEITSKEYELTNGGYFTAGTIKATNQTPQITFWLKAGSSEDYETVKEVLQSFKFLN